MAIFIFRPSFEDSLRSICAMFLIIIGGLSLTYVYAEETEYISEPKKIDQALVVKILDQKKHVLKSLFGAMSLAHQTVKLTDGHIAILVKGGANSPIVLLRSICCGKENSKKTEIKY